MTPRPLAGRHILLVEDEYLIALVTEDNLLAAGAIVVGPIGTLDEARRVVSDTPQIDGAVLDINLGGQPVYPVADALAARGIPFVFASGYDEAVIPDRYAAVRRCDKPLSIADLIEALGLR